MKREISIAFQTDKSAQQYVALAQLVDAYPFDVVSLYCDAPYHPPYAPLMLMAPHIKRARVGVAAASPFRIHPIDIAAQTALLAELASGGVYIGLARGAWLETYGFAVRHPVLRAMREAVAIVRALLSGSPGGYEGQVFRLPPHFRPPYPLPNEPIPILIGTWGQQLGAIAGEIADEVKIGGSTNPAMIPVMRQAITQGQQRANRPADSVGIVMGAICVIDDDRYQARAMARRAVALYLPVVAALDPTVTIDPELLRRLQDLVARHAWDEAAAIISDDLLDIFAFSGTPDDIIQQCHRLYDAGATRIEFGTPHGLKPEHGIRLLGEQVVPILRSTWDM